MRLILEEQLKYLQSFINNATYHPMKPDADVTYQTVNLFSSNKFFICFISDCPHYSAIWGNLTLHDPPPSLCKKGAIALSYPPTVRVRATVKLSAAFFHDESSITIGGDESSIAPKKGLPLSFSLAK